VAKIFRKKGLRGGKKRKEIGFVCLGDRACEREGKRIGIQRRAQRSKQLALRAMHLKKNLNNSVEDQPDKDSLHG